MDYSKIEAGKLFIDKTQFHMGTMVEETIDILAVKAFGKGLELICDIDPQLMGAMIGDPARLKQILTNLLGNAIKFTEKGEVVLTVSKGKTWSAAENKTCRSVAIAVRDTGIGISKENIDQVFERFIQADSSTTRIYGGTGLGLTIARNLAELMGGSLTVQSEQGKGSVFTLLITLESENDPISETPAEAGIRKPHLNKLTDNAAVLVAEDEPVNMMLISEVLSKMGFEVLKATNGREALALLDEHDPSVIFMDVNMPEMDGLEATLAIRQLPGHKRGIPIIALTADVMKKDKEHCLAAGMDHFVSKPFRLDEIEEALKLYIS